MSANPEFSVEASSGPGGLATIRLHGDVDGTSKAALPAAYARAVASGEPGGVLLDFTDVGYINSTGIAVIVGVLAVARADRRTVSARGLSEHYRHIFTITRLVDFIHLVDTAPTSA
jgi:anti-sigma B factor antagonist